jgi:hypothetical protein
MKLLKKHKEILNELIKGKGYFKTPTVPKNHQENILDDLVNLYLKDLLVFNREYDVPSFGPSSEHKVRYKWYTVTMSKTRTIKDLKKVVKDGKI